MKKLMKSIIVILLSFGLTVFMACNQTTNNNTGKTEQDGSNNYGDNGDAENPEDNNKDELPDTSKYKNYKNEKTSLDADDYSKFEPDHTVVITLGEEVKAKCDDGKEKTVKPNDDKKMFEVDNPDDPEKPLKCQVKIVSDNAKKEDAAGIEIENETSESVKYILKGEYTGTIKIKNKESDCAVVLDGLKLTSVSGPVLHITSESKRTFILAEPETESILVDGRVLNETKPILNDKKGSIYAKGPVIFAGEGTINLTNTGYKHAIYSCDYVRIASGNLNVSVAKDKKTGRDCIRALNAFIMDGGKVNLEGYGTNPDDESCGIKVEGEDADDPTDEKPKYTFTAGAGFVIINGGELNINTYAKGITAHWKEKDTCIGASGYKEAKTKSVLVGTSLLAADATMPEPYVEINGGKIEVKTFGEKTEECNPKGIEAKATLTINDGCVVIVDTESGAKPLDCKGDPVINGGVVIANGEVLANGKKD